MSDAEMVDVSDVVVDARDVVARLPNRFQPGNKIGGRKTGSLNRINRMVKEAMSEDIERGEKRHPCQILLDIANDTEVNVSVRRAAAADLMPYFMPIKFNVEVETAEVDQTIEYERIRATLSSLTGAK